jgi:hypothetical protein
MSERQSPRDVLRSSLPVPRERPQEIRKDRVLANFRPTAAERYAHNHAPKKSFRAQRSGMSEEHLAAIRQLACCVCPNYWSVDPHHLKTGPAKSERGVGLKATDRWCVPLCRAHHDELEALGSRKEPGFFHDRAIDHVGLALGLWNVSPNVEAMWRVLEAHKQDACRTLAAERRERRAQR